MHTVAMHAALPANVEGIAYQKEDTVKLKRAKRTTARPKTVVGTG